jgi:acetyl-CoA acetyltransferase|tara:strand:- start:1134 stop:1412 length:279 start_codon:yes stop_codon:yes gene_type:complete
MGVKLFMGNVLQVVSGQVLACQAALIAGVPVAVPCTSVNKVCSSSMKSISMVAKAIALRMFKLSLLMGWGIRSHKTYGGRGGHLSPLWNHSH